jgi:hypothetical protein
VKKSFQKFRFISTFKKKGIWFQFEAPKVQTNVKIPQKPLYAPIDSGKKILVLTLQKNFLRKANMQRYRLNEARGE